MGKKVIIFDDDQDILEVTVAILHNRNFEVKGVDHLDGFLDKVLKYSPDVILMDLRIPEIGGEEATRLLKNTSSTTDIPIIIFTAHSNGEKNIKDITGANDVVYKPFNINTLVRKIERIITA